MAAAPNSLLTVAECARRLNVSECWVRRHGALLRVIRVGGSLRYDPRVLTAFCTNSSQPFIVPADGAPSEPESESFMLRRYQRGSVYKVGKKIKVWYGMFRVDQKNPDGSLIRKQKNVRLGTLQDLPTKAAAVEALRRLMGAHSKPSTRMTFAELVTRWKAAAVPAMKSSTALHYQMALRRVEPVFEKADVATITRHDVERFVQDKARVYSRATLRSLRTTLSLVLGYAVENSWLEKNPVAGVKLPRAENCGGKAINRCVLSPAQVMNMVGHLEEPYSTLVLLLAVTGLRIGECAGLRWSDLVGNVLHVERRVYCGSVDDLKTKGSRRKLPLSPEIVVRLEKLRKDGSWIFQASNGAPLNPGNWLKREIRPAAVRAGIVLENGECALTGWHDFRHFFSTQLRRGGTHPKLVSNLLGHANVHLALDVYDSVELGELVTPCERVASQVLCDVTKTAARC